MSNIQWAEGASCLWPSGEFTSWPDASPDVSNGYTRIANELLEALAATPMADADRRVLLYVLRQTYGYGRKEVYIKQRTIAEVVDLTEFQVSRSLARLRERNVLAKNGKKIGIQKRYQRWRNLPKLTSSKIQRRYANLDKQLVKSDKKNLRKLTSRKSANTSIHASLQSIKKKKESILKKRCTSCTTEFIPREDWHDLCDSCFLKSKQHPSSRYPKCPYCNVQQNYLRIDHNLRGCNACKPFEVE